MSQASPASTRTTTTSTRATPASPPTHIPLPDPPTFSNFVSDASPASPFVQFYTAPSSPFTLIDAPADAPQPSLLADRLNSLDNAPRSPLGLVIPPMASTSRSSGETSATNEDHSTAKSPMHVEDTFPSLTVPYDLPLLDQDDLNPLEKIYCYSVSKAVFHRVHVAETLPQLLEEVDPNEAVVYILPLLSGLALDQDEQVKESMASKLVEIVWWFFTNCQPIMDEMQSYQPSSSTSSFQFSPVSPTAAPPFSPVQDHEDERSFQDFKPTIPVDSFTPIIGTLLLSSNPTIAEHVRFAVVEILRRIKEDEAEATGSDPSSGAATRSRSVMSDREARRVVSKEVLQRIVIGMGRLDEEGAEGTEPPETPGEEQFFEVTESNTTPGPSSALSARSPPATTPKSPHEHDHLSFNPYFPPVPRSSDSSSSSSSSSSSAASPGSYSSSSPYTASPPSSSKSSPSSFPSIQSTSIAVLKASSTPDLSDYPSVCRSELAYESLTQPPSQLPHSSVAQPELYPTKFPSSYADPGSGQPPSAEVSIVVTPAAEDIDDEHGSVGRLCSMSLIAAVAASGCISEHTKSTFVNEVTRVSRDDIHWVRREASFALGALAKIVPQELVVISLLPLFERFRSDSDWHVRHSTLLSLPGILSRLKPSDRRSTALSSIPPLSKDEYAAVRLGAFEALGEVIYSFHEDPQGSPQELVQLFLCLARKKSEKTTADDNLTGLSPEEDEATRALICAFSFPAVTLTLGRDRWRELRASYINLASNTTMRVRVTLAASLGEMAKLIGPENASRDLLNLWKDSIHSEEEEVRLKAAGSFGVLLKALNPGDSTTVLDGVLSVWKEGGWRGWREREIIANTLCQIIDVVADRRDTVRRLVMLTLEDSVAAVREAALTSLPRIWTAFSTPPSSIKYLMSDIDALARAPNHKKRMTFVSCQQALVHPNGSGEPAPLAADNKFWTRIAATKLADDPILGVRIALGRLVGLFSGRDGDSTALRNLSCKLSADSSPEVRAYVTPPPVSATGEIAARTAPGLNSEPTKAALTFSRPPPNEVGIV